MPTPLHFGRDNQGYNAFAPTPSVNKYSATLPAAGNATITLPATAQSWIVAFSYTPGSNIWVAYNTSAAAPAGATFAASNSELNPGSRELPTYRIDGTTSTTINILNGGASSSDISVVLYANS